MPRKRKRLDRRAVNAYGGDLQKRRSGRFCGRPLSLRQVMHFVLKSTQACGEKGFRRPRNYLQIGRYIERFGAKHGVHVHDYAIHHNHLHLTLTPTSVAGYKRFIRALSAAIAVFVGGASRWAKEKGKKFWDRRPFSRIALDPREELVLGDYIQINKLEAGGFSRWEARRFYAWETGRRRDRLRRQA